MRILAALPVVALLAVFPGPADASDPWRTFDLGASRIVFEGRALESVFDGRFTQFQADVFFDSDDLAASRAVVTLYVASVDTRNSDRDAVILSSDWFDAGAFPVARFTSGEFRHEGGDRYIALGVLAIRDVEAPVTVPFTVTEKENRALFEGEFVIRRTEFGIGRGDWAETIAIDDPVAIAFRLVVGR